MPRIGILHAVVVAAALAVANPAASPIAAQESDVIRGRVTNVDGNPLSGVRVTATSIPGNVTREVRTDNRGNYQIIFPGGTGDYMMGFALIGYIYRLQQVKRLADEAVLVANITLQVVQLDTITVAAPVQQRVNRNSQTPDVSGTERQINTNELPANLLGDIAAMAASLPGVLLVPGLDGGQDGFSVLGLGTDQNSTTLNGSSFSGGNLPRDAQVGTSLTTSPFDVGRGGFSGGNFNITTPRGSNFRTRGSSLVFNTPYLEWTDAAGRALGSEYTNVSVGGVVSGPLVLNKAFYNVSYQLGRQSRENRNLLNTNRAGLQAAGVAEDSVRKLTDILGTAGVPGLGGNLYPQRLSDNGSFFGTVDISPPNATSGQSFGFTFNGNWSKQAPAFGSTTQLPSANGDRLNWSGGLQARHSSYMKLVLSETSVGVNLSRDHGDPYLDLPGGRVRVTSDFTGGSSGVQNLVFGGNQGLSSRSRGAGGSFTNNLSWFDEANRHRVKLTTEAQYNSNWRNPANNMMGTFAFNSLADLEDSLPASYSRTLYVNTRSTGSVSGSIALGDSYRRTQDLQIQYGIRADATRALETPTFNPAVETAFGRRNDRIPTPIAVSPRIGFSWTLGDANEIQAFFGQARAPRAVVRGGIGVFANTSASGQVGNAIDNTGLPSGTRQLMCIGPAAPRPEWAFYAAFPDSVPADCVGGASTPFSNAQPNVTLFSEDFTNPRSIRSNLSWQGPILDARFSTNIEGSLSLNQRQTRTFDLNFDDVTRFTLAGENRPVFVDTASIAPATGGIAARDARVNQSFARVSEVRSDMASRTAQVSIRLSPIIRSPVRWGWNASYTYQHVTEKVSGFNSTNGSPLSLVWGRASQGPHQITYNLRYNFFDAVNVSWNGQFRSGASYTPMVAGDINGDGYNNDRAFVFAPASPADTTALANGMKQLLQNSTGAVRECLEDQVGRIASRNSCRAPWSSSASLNITLDRVKFRFPQRFNVSFSLTNPMGAADLLMHGSGNLRGWGQTPTPDQQLLYVRGFNPTTRTYQYEVNQRFGATRPQVLTLRQPVVLTTSVRLDMGPTRERQTLEQNIGAGRNRPGAKLQENFFRQQGPGSISNPLTALVRQADTLRLTAVQADSIAVLNRRYTYRADSIWAPIAKQFAGLGQDYDMGEQFTRYLNARRAQIDMLMKIVPEVNRLLTPEQKRKLPPFIVTWLDPRYLASVRSGTNTYSGGGGGGGPAGVPIFFGGGDMVMVR